MAARSSLLRRVIRGLLSIVFLGLLYVGVVIGYAMLTDYQPEPVEPLTSEGSANIPVASKQLTLLTWNIGYAGQGAEADFFYDGGQAVRQSPERVQGYMEGIVKELKSRQAETDFFLLQEVDQEAKRSHGIDEVMGIGQASVGFGYGFAPNYQVAFIPIPFLDPMGQVRGGLVSLNRFQAIESFRHQYAGNYDWPTYLFFLDRCFLLQRFAVDSSDKELVVINTHNSAYDDGSLKQRQLDQLKKVLLAEYQKGNYVVVGGDWNMTPPAYRGLPGEDLAPQPEREVPAVYPAPDWQWAYDDQVATNRSLEAPFDPAKSRQSVIDFFLLSPNIALESVEGVDLQFKDSDHQPVQCVIRLLP